MDQPITTENLARHIHERALQKVPVHRVRLHERSDFFAEHWPGGKYFSACKFHLAAAHRLHSGELPVEQNAALYGKCNNPRGHGHRYLTEATIGGDWTSGVER